MFETADFPAGIARSRFSSRFLNIERRAPSNTVFDIDDKTFASGMVRPTHWSIAWSDLMMTMFVLFLSMYVYQMANEDFLDKKTPEIIGGDTTDALLGTSSSEASFPFAPIHPGLPLMTGGTLKKIERVPPPSQLREDLSLAQENPVQQENTTESILLPTSTDPVSVAPEKVALLVEVDKNHLITPTPPLPGPEDTVVEPRPLALAPSQPVPADRFQEMYTLSKGALDNNNLNKFASIEIVPDKTLRIILTGDLLFEQGRAELSGAAQSSLTKLTKVLKNTPYMINVVGHTDNVPMRSTKFQSNWELSVARASTVARFLIEDTRMNPNQFVVSGYSSYRPVVPNTTTANRARNRRVEIIISKRLPQPTPATSQNLY
ncbi:MAG: OmpA/MotB family protein [Desulforhopalus sp.]